MSPIQITLFATAGALALGMLIMWAYFRLRIPLQYIQKSIWLAQEANLQQCQQQLRDKEQAIQWLQDKEQQLTIQYQEEKQKNKEQLLVYYQVNNDAVRRKAQIESLEKQALAWQSELEDWRQKYEASQAAVQELHQKNTVLSSQQQHLEQRLREQQQHMEEYGNQLKKEFQLLADNVLSAKASTFNLQQESKLNDLLTPVRQKLDEFRKDITSQFLNANTERTRLEEQVRQMAALNQQLSRQAENLTKALTSQVKQQGNWGEEILETILQYVGLQKDLHYQVQHTATNAEGQTIRPDFVVRYPDDRYVVIDSKVSLVHYQRFAEAQNPEEQQQWLNALARSVRQHIDGLAGKHYHHITGSLDYVFLFVPVEGAFITCLQADHALWQYAFDKRILLVSPTLLLSGMKLVHELWKQDSVNKNAQQMAERAGKLYDKLALFVESFEEIGQRLEQAGKSFTQARAQLMTGRGNALTQAEGLRKLNAHTRKQIITGEASEEEVD